jgi:hypothetical protein
MSSNLHILDHKLCASVFDIFFFLVTRGVRASLRAPQLIPGPTEHPASPVGR